MIVAKPVIKGQFWILQQNEQKIGNVEDMSQAVEYLLNANWVTGQIFHVDGGMSAIR
jgi:NAD(P)-dependent dehydrogenase (short-subunit alcohol dehydrogenase family)